MTDIVERLRRLPPSPIAFGDSEANKRNRAERIEAADEIERLEAKHDDYVIRANANVCELNREIKRLQAALQDIAIGVGESVLSQDAMRARAFDALQVI